MHGKRRYVKLAWIWLGTALALALPWAGRAEIVAPTLSRGFLAVGPDGSPRVAFFSGRDVVLARRGTTGWTFAGLGRVLTGKAAVIEGVVVDGKARTSLLLAADDGSWLALADRGRKLRVVARPRRGASFGPAGLTLDAAGRPAFAYAVRLRAGKTYLRLVTTDARGRLRTRAVTKQGFPSSALAPGAAPVLVQGRLHVVETYTSAAIDWQPQAKGRWVGQYLFASRSGSPAGRVSAAADGGALWSAWTQMSSDSVSVLLTLSAATQETTTVVDHGIFVSLLIDAGRPEIGAYDWVQLGDWFAYAGLLTDESGPFTEVDGLVEGYAAAPGGGRQLLLSTDNGLEWFETPARPSIRVSFSADATGELSGRVEGASGGLVHVYREAPNGPRTLIANAELAPDGSFTAEAGPPASPTFYRAVYVEPSTGIPYASLLRKPVG